MKKLVFEYLAVEVTRRCNLKCAHCLRGEAQNVDIPTAIIEQLLMQTEQIHNLLFTGGEPSLNLEAMRFFLVESHKRGIAIDSIEIITNGVLHCAEFVELLKAYASSSKVELKISNDRYHRAAGSDPIGSLSFYSDKLNGLAKVALDERGDNPIKTGRATKLQDAVDPSIYMSFPHRIAIVEEGKDCECRYSNEWEISGNKSIICCPLHLSALGTLSRLISYNGEFTTEDSKRELVIADMSSAETADIEAGIKCYNQKYPSCDEAEKASLRAQNEDYRQHPHKSARDLRYGYAQMMKGQVPEVTALLDQNPDAKEYLTLLNGMLELAELIPEDELRKFIK